MRVICGAFVCALATVEVMAGALANEVEGPEYKITLSAGAPYTFADDFSLPRFDPTAIEGGIRFGATFDDWAFGYNHFETERDEGDKISGEWSQNECPIDARIECSLGMVWTSAGGLDYRTYSAGISDGWTFENGVTNWAVKPKWTLGASILTGDRADSVLKAGIELPFVRRRVFTLRLIGGADHSLESSDTKPSWGARLEYKFSDGWEARVGYASSVTLDDETGKFGEINRSATASISYTFQAPGR